MARIVFMGSPEFAVPILRAVAAHHRVMAVVTRPDRPAGRGARLTPPPAKLAAGALGLPVFQPERLHSTDSLERLRELSPDLIIVAAFGQILKPAVLGLPSHGAINVHASLLPRWRGAAPIQAAILAGDAETGITVMLMDEGLDTGAILAQERLAISAAETGGSLSEKLAALGAKLLLRTLPEYLAGVLQPIPQDPSGATHAPMLKKEDGLLDFAMPARTLERRVRAFNPWPCAYLTWNELRLKVLRAHVEKGVAEIGKRLRLGKLPAVGTSEDFLVLDEVQPPGKRAMDGKSFLLGARGWGE